MGNLYLLTELVDRLNHPTLSQNSVEVAQPWERETNTRFVSGLLRAVNLWYRYGKCVCTCVGTVCFVEVCVDSGGLFTSGHSADKSLIQWAISMRVHLCCLCAL